MNIRTVTATPLSGQHADVASMVNGARVIGPVLLLDDGGAPQGIVLAFDRPEAAKELLASQPDRFVMEVARALAEGVAGRPAAL